MDSKILEAKEKLNSIVLKARSNGIAKTHITRLAKSRKLTPATRVLPFPMVLPFLIVISGFGLQGFNFYWNPSSNRQCALTVPDTMTRIFRPPVSCAACRGITKIENFSKLSQELFEKRFAYTGVPVIITDATENWTAPSTFSFEFFQNLYKDRYDSILSKQCQFFPYKTNFNHLGEFLNLTTYLVERITPWYVGWSNCDVEITELLREHYQRPYFLPPFAEGKRLDWIFMGSKGYGAPMHVDNVEYPSWQAQLRGKKKWVLQPPPECFYVCTPMEVIVDTGDTIVLDTNRWYHSTEIVSEELSITIGAEFD